MKFNSYYRSIVSTTAIFTSLLFTFCDSPTDTTDPNTAQVNIIVKDYPDKEVTVFFDGDTLFNDIFTADSMAWQLSVTKAEHTFGIKVDSADLIISVIVDSNGTICSHPAFEIGGLFITTTGGIRDNTFIPD